MNNAMSIDLEDWFCVYNLSGIIKKEEWDKQELRVIENTEKLLALFRQYNTKVTFFVLGYIAEKVPELIRKIEENGHEIAIHGYSHSLLTEITPEAFNEDIRKVLEIVGKCVNQEIEGFRAPSFSITKKTMWAIGILEKYGIKYDSSVFPIGYHPDYGISDAPLSIYKIGESLIEVPLSVVEILGKRIPCSGGGYFRQFPYFITKYLIDKCNESGRPVIFYLHPWEIDPDQPKINLPLIKRIRHYNNLYKTYFRLERLLKDFKFITIKELINVSKY